MAFWSESVGLDLVSGGGLFASLDGGGVLLTLNEVERPVDDPSRTEIVFEAEDIMAADAELAERGVLSRSNHAT